MRTTAAFSRHTMLALLEALILAGGILASAAVLKPGIGSTGAGNAAAANPNRSGESRIWLTQPDGAATAANWPTLGNTVAFGATYPKATKNPWVSLRCYQGNNLVYGAGGGVSEAFLLGGASSEWLTSPGPALCTAQLGDLYWRGGHESYTYLADTTFTTN